MNRKYLSHNNISQSIGYFIKVLDIKSGSKSWKKILLLYHQ